MNTYNEKHIEFFVANNIKDVFPDENLELIQCQYRLKNNKIIDILFENKMNNELVVFEVKKSKNGSLSDSKRREAVGQLIEYKGILTKEFPNKKIRLVLCSDADISHEVQENLLSTANISYKEINGESVNGKMDTGHYHSKSVTATDYVGFDVGCLPLVMWFLLILWVILLL